MDAIKNAKWRKPRSTINQKLSEVLCGITSPKPNTRDIREVKNELREKYRNIRETMDPNDKSEWDELIFKKITSTKAYIEAKTVLCFVSTRIEVDTLCILNHAWQSGKKVAVPKCLDKSGKMDFFYIRSMSELHPSFFGLLEPDEKKSEKYVGDASAICILPGFAFDSEGYRIGFGKGYYDRFLQKYSGIKAGICYNNCIASQLPHGRYDAAANFVVTPKYILQIKH